MTWCGAGWLWPEAARIGEGRAGGEGPLLGGEEDDHGGDFLGLAETADRNARNHALKGCFRHGRDHVGADIARRDRVDGDVLVGVLLGQCLDEADVAGLGGGVVDLAHLALLAVDRGDHDDAAEGAGAHALDHRTGDREHRVEVGLDDRLPFLEGHLVERAVAGDAGIVHQDVDGTELGLDGLDAGLAGSKIADVELEDGNAGLGLELLGAVVGRLVEGFVELAAHVEDDGRLEVLSRGATHAGQKCQRCRSELDPHACPPEAQAPR